MYSVGDLAKIRRGAVYWYAHGPLEALLPHLTTVVPAEQLPLGVGQCWKLAARYGEIKPDEDMHIAG